MIYKIKKLSEEKYELLFQGNRDYVNLNFLEERLKPYKLTELLENGETSVRDNWNLGESAESQVVIEETDKEEKESPKKWAFGDGYEATVSKHENLFELWQYHTDLGWRFVSYLFHLDSASTLIKEDKSWLKYKKKLRRNVAEADLRQPEENKYGIR